MCMPMYNLQIAQSRFRSFFYILESNSKQREAIHTRTAFSTTINSSSAFYHFEIIVDA